MNSSWEYEVAHTPSKKEHVQLNEVVANDRFTGLWHPVRLVYSDGMTNKTFFWSYHDVADFLKENGFDFMEDLDGSKGAWVKLKKNGEPGVVFEFKFTPAYYSKREINRIIRLSEISESKWTDWFEARPSETAP